MKAKQNYPAMGCLVLFSLALLNQLVCPLLGGRKNLTPSHPNPHVPLPFQDLSGALMILISININLTTIKTRQDKKTKINYYVLKQNLLTLSCHTR